MYGTMGNKLLLVALVSAVPLAVVEPVPASDEQASLKLLVETLETVEEPNTQVAILTGMLAGLSGRRDVPPPPRWAKLAERLQMSRDDRVRELATELAQIFGDEQAAMKALTVLADHEAPAEERRRALFSLVAQKDERLVPLLDALLEVEDLRLDVIRSFAAIEVEGAAMKLLDASSDWAPAHRKAVIETLATRRSYAEGLLAALEAEKLMTTDVPSHVARSLQRLLGERFVNVYGDVRQLSQDRDKLIGRCNALLTDDAVAEADAAAGRVIFNKTCASCHQLYGEGGDVGPDLTGSNRANLDYILLNSVDPSYDVPEGYKMVLIETIDGLVVNGVVAEEDAQRVVLKTAQQPRVVILKSDIEVREISKQSIMPDGQFEALKPDELKNLIKYLRTTEQVELQ